MEVMTRPLAVSSAAPRLVVPYTAFAMDRVDQCVASNGHHFFYLGVVDAARRTGPGIVVEAVESAPGETVPPLRDRNPAAAHLRGDVHIGAAFGRSQHDTRPHR